MKIKFIPDIVRELLDMGKEFIRKRDGTAECWLKRLKYLDTSASLGNFRKREEKSCKLPISVFK